MFKAAFKSSGKDKGGESSSSKPKAHGGSGSRSKRPDKHDKHKPRDTDDRQYWPPADYHEYPDEFYNQQNLNPADSYYFTDPVPEDGSQDAFQQDHDWNTSHGGGHDPEAAGADPAAAPPSPGSPPDDRSAWATQPNDPGPGDNADEREQDYDNLPQAGTVKVPKGKGKAIAPLEDQLGHHDMPGAAAGPVFSDQTDFGYFAPATGFHGSFEDHPQDVGGGGLDHSKGRDSKRKPRNKGKDPATGHRQGTDDHGGEEPIPYVEQGAAPDQFGYPSDDYSREHAAAEEAEASPEAQPVDKGRPPLNRWEVQVNLKEATRKEDRWRNALGYIDSGNRVGLMILYDTVHDMGFRDGHVDFDKMVEFNTLGGPVKTLGVIRLTYWIMSTGGVEDSQPEELNDEFHILKRSLDNYEVWLQADGVYIDHHAVSAPSHAASMQPKRNLTKEEKRQQKESFLRQQKDADKAAQKKKEREKKEKERADREEKERRRREKEPAEAGPSKRHGGGDSGYSGSYGYSRG